MLNSTFYKVNFVIAYSVHTRMYYTYMCMYMYGVVRGQFDFICHCQHLFIVWDALTQLITPYICEMLRTASSFARAKADDVTFAQDS